VLQWLMCCCCAGPLCGVLQVINHELPNPQSLSAAAAGEGAAHQQVLYRQSCNAIEAFVNDLPDIIAHLA
jgi:hypothetical protein